ncbi:MAG: hypothetical protein GF311_23900 [Candidatus Lokiarchaeota archaeon]|nr:hypothetical protein [Candidatus Lokiarchaeota archaeon]
MSLKNTSIDEFLQDVKSKFPEWLKAKPEQVNDILADLELQVIEKAREISGMEEPPREAIKEAIYAIGTPESIAKVYKKRGTPKFYITEELWDFYLRALLFSMAVVVIINFIRVIVLILFAPWYALLGEFLSGVYIGFLIVLVVTTGLFAFLSMEGYLPEDFGDLPRYLGLIIQTKTTEVFREREYTEQFEPQTQAQIAETKVRVKEGIEEAKIKIAEAKEKVKEARIEAKKKFRSVSTAELITGSVLGIVFGLILIIQPFYDFLVYFEPEFREWMSTFGMVVLIGGLIELVRLAIGADSIGGQKVMLVINGLYNIAYFPLVIYLINRPDIFPIYLFSGFQISAITPGIALDIYYWVGAAILIGLTISIVYNIYKAARLGEPVE